MTVAGKFGIKKPSTPTPSPFITDYRFVGIEIEQEYEDSDHALFDSIVNNRFEDIKKHWRVEGDGSLRGLGCEFISGLLYPGDVIEALESAMPYVEQGTSSWRCAIHVHVDARDMSEDQLTTMCELYSILEPLIFAWEGTGRDNSRFCVPWYASVHSVQKVAASLDKGPTDISSTLNSFGKYTACNLSPITSFGSVEFRHMSTVPDLEKIIKYVDICTSIVETSTKGITPLMEFSSVGADRFIQEVFGGRLNFLTQVPDYIDLLWKGIDTANAIHIANHLSFRPSNKVDLQKGHDMVDSLSKILGVKESVSISSLFNQEEV